MKKNTKSARPTDDEVRARDKVVDAIVKKGEAERMRVRHLVSANDFANPKEAGAGPAVKSRVVQFRRRIFDRFSQEQQIQISRLTRAGGFEDTDGSSTADWTITELASLGLYALGLDRLSEDAASQLATVVYGKESSFEADLFNAINSEWGTAESWTKQQRADELAKSLKVQA